MDLAQTFADIRVSDAFDPGVVFWCCSHLEDLLFDLLNYALLEYVAGLAR